MVIGHLLFAMVALAGCASAPVYPDPTPGEGQILVELKGIPREGVKGPARETVREEYSSHSESVEKGKAFERVKYDDIEDVLVVVTRFTEYLEEPYVAPPMATKVDLRSGGFRPPHVAALIRTDKMAGTTGASVLIYNNRTDAVTLFASGPGERWLTMTIDADMEGELILPSVGRYVVLCDEDPTVELVVEVVATRHFMICDSRTGAFFDRLPPGTYDVDVFAPRLPAVRRQITVEAGKRTTITAELTVNHLPKAR